MEFEFVENTLRHKIKVIGVGGAGNNAVNNMITSGLEGVAFIAANTDLQDLEQSAASVKLQLGNELTRGLGCGADPDVGRNAALEDVERVKELLADSDMVFITAGMGGGTGTGGAPVIAECLKDVPKPPLTVAVVTKPFRFEGGRRMRQAEEGIAALREFADTIITIPNDRLMSTAPRGTSIKDAFRLADDVLLQAVKGVSDLILLPGFINVDFKDAEKVMSNQGHALMGTGLSSGPERATAAAQQAINSPLLEDVSIKGARGLLINISCSENNVTLEEVDQACSMIQAEADEDAVVIFGVAWDNTLEDNLRITVIATGIGEEEDRQPLREIPGKKDTATPEEVFLRGEHYQKPPAARERRDRRVKSMADFERPQYTKYESFIHDEEDLERPTFMRRKAD
jgi:cell division protein FtsZ